MFSEISLDTCRFVFLLTSLIIHHIITSYITFNLFNSYIRYFFYSWQIFSVLYLILCALRKGYIDYQSKDFLRLDYQPSTRYCKVCKGYKPIRAHHCSRCNRCIKKMDHHCMWLGVCVNYDNHGDFVRFLFFSVTSMLFSLTGHGLYIYNSVYITTLMRILLSILIFSSLLVIAFCGIMFKIQVDLINKNVTFIEDQHYYTHEDLSAFDRGLFNNWSEVMGSLFLCWMWRPGGSGIEYVRNDGLEDDDICFV